MSETDPFNFQARERNIRKFPGANPNNELKNFQKELREQDRARATFIKETREVVKGEGFLGKPINVIPDKDNINSVWITSGSIRIRLDILRNTEEGDETELTDSLKKNGNYRHRDIDIYGIDKGNALKKLTSIGEMSDAALTASRVIKQIERIESPQTFGYTKILLSREYGEIKITGIRPTGKSIALDFFLDKGSEDRKDLYNFIVDYVGLPVDILRT